MLERSITFRPDKDRSLFTAQGAPKRNEKSMYKKITQPLWVFKFFTQPLIEIQDFKAAFVNLTRSDCFICFCHCVFHVYVINCVRLFAIITHCSMFSYSHWSFFSPNLFSKRFQKSVTHPIFRQCPLIGCKAT